MPRLENGQLLISAKRFKKRRAWLTSDTELAENNQTTTDEQDGQLGSNKIAIPIFNESEEDETANEQLTDGGQLANKQLTRSYESDFKNVTNTPSSTITKYELANKQLTDGKQIANNQLTTSNFPSDCAEYHKEIANNQLTNSKQIANRQLTDSKQIANKIERFSFDSPQKTLEIMLKLSKQQRTLFFYIHERCLENDARSSGPIESHIFSSLISASNNTVRTQLQRLIAKNLLQRLPGKPGPGGFHEYSMASLVIRAGNELRRHFCQNFGSENRTTLNETANKQLTDSKQTANKLANNGPLSSSSNLINTTTTKENPLENAEPETNDVDEIDITPLEGIGFKKSHLAQIKKRTDLSPEAIQASIHHFAFDLKTNQKAAHLKSPPLNFFMGILTKGIPYSPPDNFEDEKGRALREFIEKQRAQKERLAELAEEAKCLAFDTWHAGLTDQERKTMLPSIFKTANDFTKLSWFKGHFDKEVWPTYEISQSVA